MKTVYILMVMSALNTPPSLQEFSTSEQCLAFGKSMMAVYTLADYKKPEAHCIQVRKTVEEKKADE